MESVLVVVGLVVLMYFGRNLQVGGKRARCSCGRWTHSKTIAEIFRVHRKYRGPDQCGLCGFPKPGTEAARRWEEEKSQKPGQGAG